MQFCKHCHKNLDQHKEKNVSSPFSIFDTSLLFLSIWCIIILFFLLLLLFFIIFIRLLFWLLSTLYWTGILYLSPPHHTHYRWGGLRGNGLDPTDQLWGCGWPIVHSFHFILGRDSRCRSPPKGDGLLRVLWQSWRLLGVWWGEFYSVGGYCYRWSWYHPSWLDRGVWWSWWLLWAGVWLVWGLGEGAEALSYADWHGLWMVTERREW